MSTSEPERDYSALVHIQAVLQSRSDTQCAAVLDNPAWVSEIIAAIESRAIPIISVRTRNAGDEAEAGPPHILRMRVQGIHRDDPQMIMQPEMRVHGTLDLNHAATRAYHEQQQREVDPADQRDRIHTFECPCGATHRSAVNVHLSCEHCHRNLILRTNGHVLIECYCNTCARRWNARRREEAYTPACPSCGQAGQEVPAAGLEVQASHPAHPRPIQVYLTSTQGMQFTAVARNRDDQDALVRQLNDNPVVVSVRPAPTNPAAPQGYGTLDRIVSLEERPNLHVFGGVLSDAPSTAAMFDYITRNLSPQADRATPAGVPNYQHHARPRPTLGQIVELEDGRRGVLQSERDQADGSSVAYLTPFAWAGFMPEVHTALTRLPEGPERTILTQHILTMVSDYRTIVKQLHNLRERHKHNLGNLTELAPDTRIVELD